jgi:SAM-dependent methyltransferase
MIIKLVKRIPFFNEIYKSIESLFYPQGIQWCRVVMDKETDNLIKNLPYNSFNTLEISGNKWKDYNFKNYQDLSYPDFDICSMQINERFDLIIAEQVFEHLNWPYRAGRNIYEMLQEGGYFLITTPFLLKIHNFPVDCSRWTPTGIKYFLAECGFDFDSIVVGSWGNKVCLKSNLKEWKLYNPNFHSLKNEEEFPLVVWALAKKIRK